MKETPNEKYKDIKDDPIQGIHMSQIEFVKNSKSEELEGRVNE